VHFRRLLGKLNIVIQDLVENYQRVGILFPAGARDFSLLHNVQSRTQPPIQLAVGAFSMGVNWQGCEADHSTPSNA
jgi:hypothetical protein